MPQQLKYVAQLAMDSFYQQYKGENDFWELDDFIEITGNTIAAMFTDIYKQQYAMIRQERNSNADTVSFDAGWLLEQEVEVKKNGVGLFAILDKPVMTFPYDNSSCGIQNIFISDPFSVDELERTSLSKLWELKYMPKTNRIFFYSDVAPTSCITISKIGLVNRGICNIKKIRVLYVPSMEENANVPDGLIADAINKTVLAMKQIAVGNVIDSTENQNSNKVMQSEIDKTTLLK